MKICRLFLSALAFAVSVMGVSSVSAAPAGGSVPLRIAIAGDSTVADYKLTDPHRGWEQIFPEVVDAKRVTVNNFAKNGRSTKTFKSEGLWDKALAWKPDYIYIQFGHNDSHAKSHPEATDAKTDYREYLRGFIDTARAAGAVPILVTPMHRGTWDTDGAHLTQELLPYADAMRLVAKEKNVPLVDLFAQSETLYASIGKDQIDSIFAIPSADHTHFNEKGARLLAAAVAEQTAIVVPALKPYLIAKPIGTGQSDGPSEMTVAADGSGTYKTVQDAINAAPTGSAAHPTVIHLTPGIYKEILYVQREKQYVHLLGDDPDPAKTLITYSLYAAMTGPDGKPIGTFRTATAFIDADDFTVQNVTFENSAGPVGQALAVRLDGDRIAFRHCRFLGWQDTILDNRGRHYFDHCAVQGAVDFIFGGGTAFYDHCDIIDLRDQGGDISAPSTPQEQPYGLVFASCRIKKGPGAAPGGTGLMRPWRGNGMSAFIDCTLDDHIKPAGWDTWSGREATCRALEFGSKTPDGKLIDISRRVPWSRQLGASEAAKFTPVTVFGGWDPN